MALAVFAQAFIFRGRGVGGQSVVLRVGGGLLFRGLEFKAGTRRK